MTQIHHLLRKMRSRLLIRVAWQILTRRKECLFHDKRKKLWFLDNGCSRHMTRDKNKFLSLEKRKDGGFVSLGDNKKSLIKGVGKIGNQTLLRLKMLIL